MSLPKSVQLFVFLFLLVWNLTAYNSRRLSGSKRWRRASTRSLNDPSRTSGLSCLYVACALPVRRIRSHKVFSSSFHLLIRAVIQPVGETPLAAESLGHYDGSANAHPANYAKCSRFCGCARGSHRQPQRTSMHQESLAEPTGSSNTSTYIVCVCPLDKGCCLGTKAVACVIYFLGEHTNYRKQ